MIIDVHCPMYERPRIIQLNRHNQGRNESKKKAGVVRVDSIHKDCDSDNATRLMTELSKMRTDLSFVQPTSGNVQKNYALHR